MARFSVGIGIGLSKHGSGDGASFQFAASLFAGLDSVTCSSNGSAHVFGGLSKTLSSVTCSSTAYQPGDALAIAFVDSDANPPSFAVTGPLTVGFTYYLDVGADSGFATVLSYGNEADITEQGNLSLSFPTGQLTGDRWFRMWYEDADGVPSTYSNTLTHTYSLAGGGASPLHLLFTTTSSSRAGEAGAMGKLILTRAA